MGQKDLGHYPIPADGLDNDRELRRGRDNWKGHYAGVLHKATLDSKPTGTSTMGQQQGDKGHSARP
eukprot:5609507-Amphidinium_carterae.1